MKHTYDVFKVFHELVDCIHNIMQMKWKASSLDLNTLGVEYLCFGYACFSFLGYILNAHGQKIQVSHEIFNGPMDVIKASCLGFFVWTHFESVFI